MAALTSDQPLRIWGPAYTRKLILDTSQAQAVFKSEPLIIDQSADTVNASPVHDKTHPVVAATDVMLGVAVEGKSVASGDPETLKDAGIEAYVEPTMVGFKSAVFTNADIGKTAYWEDGVLSSTAGDTAMLGTIQFVEDGYCYVKIVTAICSGA
jgi:hypothetical protein